VSSTSLVNSIKIQDANTGHNNLLAPRNGFTSYFTQQSPVTLVLLGVFFFLIKNVLSVVFLKFTYKFLAKQSMAVSVDLMQKFFERNLTFVQSRDVQSTSIGLSLGVGFLLIDVLGSFVVLFSEVFMLLFLSILVLTVFPLEGFLSVIYFVSVLALMQKYVLGIASKAGHDKTRNDIESIQLIQGMFNLYREIRLSNGANFFNQRFQGQRNLAARASMNGQFVGYLPKYLLEVALVFGAALLTYFEITTNGVSAALSVLGVFLVASSRFVPSLLRIQGALTTIRFSRSAGHPTIELANSLNSYDAGQMTPDFSSQHLDQDQLTTYSGEIHIRDLSFCYPGSKRPVIENFSAKLLTGTRNAIVGPSGSGKSTLVDLISGMHQVESEMISLGGYTPQTATKNWPHLIGYVPQSPSMMQASIADNILLGCKASEENIDRIQLLLKSANLHSLVESLSEGIHTVLGRDGFNLSGGQLQRIAIIRALFLEPKILILDEATSFLDAESEETIGIMLEKLPRTVTLITIAHRLSTVRTADQVFYFEGGKCLARGTFNEVKEAHPNFAIQAKLMGL
jgi:ABC-type multidrug transport system fused ATPase/permease subunit